MMDTEGHKDSFSHNEFVLHNFFFHMIWLGFIVQGLGFRFTQKCKRANQNFADTENCTGMFSQYVCSTGCIVSLIIYCSAWLQSDERILDTENFMQENS